MTKCVKAARLRLIKQFWHSCGHPFFNYLFFVFETTFFGLDLFYNYSKYHYAFHYSSFVLQCVHVCYILYYSCLTVLYFNVKCLRLFDFILNVEIYLLHCCTPLFLLNWAWFAATEIHSTIIKWLLFVFVLSLVHYNTRMTNMAIVNQHCMLAV